MDAKCWKSPYPHETSCTVKFGVYTHPLCAVHSFQIGGGEGGGRGGAFTPNSYTIFRVYTHVPLLCTRIVYRQHASLVYNASAGMCVQEHLHCSARSLRNVCISTDLLRTGVYTSLVQTAGWAYTSAQITSLQDVGAENGSERLPRGGLILCIYVTMLLGWLL